MERKTRLELATVCLEGRLPSIFTVFTDFIEFIKNNKINTFDDFIIFMLFINFIKFIKIGWKNGGKIFYNKNASKNEAKTEDKNNEI